jgi:peptide/nickel transport system substrate-binding protein
MENVTLANPKVSKIAGRVGKEGGVLTLSVSPEPRALGGLIADETPASVVLRMAFEGLAEINRLTGEIEPALAQSWEIGSNGCSLTFHLRRGVAWFDGEPLTADDVLFTFNDLVYNPSVDTGHRDRLTIDGKRLDVEKIDAFTVEFISPRPFPLALRQIGLTQIMPRHLFDPSYGVGSGTPAVGTGPFMVEEYIPGDRLVMVRNPNYWKVDSDGRRLPYLDRIVWLVTPDEDAELSSFRKGEIDICSLSGYDYLEFEAGKDKGNYSLYNYGPTYGADFLIFNQNPAVSDESHQHLVHPAKLKWFNDVNFRRALAHLIDKRSLMEVYNGLAYPQTSPVSPAAANFLNPAVTTYEYNPASAREILRRAGFADRDGDGWMEDGGGNRVEFELLVSKERSRRMVGEAIGEGLRKAGIKVSLRAVDFSALVEKLVDTLRWEAAIVSLSGSLEPQSLGSFWKTASKLHAWNPNQVSPATPWERRIDEIFDLAWTTSDEEERRKLYYEFQEIATREIPVIFTVNPVAIYAVRNRVRNIVSVPFGGVLHNVQEIYIEA